MVPNPNVASIRAARPGDIEALVSIAAEGFPESPRWRQSGAFARRWWNVALASPFAESWIVDVEDAPVAFAVLIVDEEGWGVERAARCGRPHDYLRTVASQLDMLIPELKRRQRLRSAARLSNRAETQVIAGERIWIELISVSTEARGTGIAQNFMQWCEIRTIAWGRNRIEYNVAPDNGRMRALGERTGYILRAHTRAGCLYSKQILSPDSNPV